MPAICVPDTGYIKYAKNGSGFRRTQIRATLRSGKDAEQELRRNWRTVPQKCLSFNYRPQNGSVTSKPQSYVVTAA